MGPDPGKLLALEKLELPRTITALRGHLGFCNHHAACCKNYAELAAQLHEKLKVGRIKGRKGSKEPVEWKKEDIKDFETLRKTLFGRTKSASGKPRPSVRFEDRCVRTRNRCRPGATTGRCG